MNRLSLILTLITMVDVFDTGIKPTPPNTFLPVPHTMNMNDIAAPLIHPVNISPWTPGMCANIWTNQTVLCHPQHLAAFNVNGRVCPSMQAGGLQAPHMPGFFPWGRHAKYASKIGQIWNRQDELKHQRQRHELKKYRLEKAEIQNGVDGAQFAKMTTFHHHQCPPTPQKMPTGRMHPHTVNRDSRKYKDITRKPHQNHELEHQGLQLQEHTHKHREPRQTHLDGPSKETEHDTSKHFDASQTTGTFGATPTYCHRYYLKESAFLADSELNQPKNMHTTSASPEAQNCQHILSNKITHCAQSDSHASLRAGEVKDTHYSDLSNKEYILNNPALYQDQKPRTTTQDVQQMKPSPDKVGPEPTGEDYSHGHDCFCIIGY